jgi:hypothetical protein
VLAEGGNPKREDGVWPVYETDGTVAVDGQGDGDEDEVMDDGVDGEPGIDGRIGDYDGPNDQDSEGEEQSDVDEGDDRSDGEQGDDGNGSQASGPDAEEAEEAENVEEAEAAVPETTNPSSSANSRQAQPPPIPYGRFTLTSRGGHPTHSYAGRLTRARTTEQRSRNAALAHRQAYPSVPIAESQSAQTFLRLYGGELDEEGGDSESEDGEEDIE